MNIMGKKEKVKLVFIEGCQKRGYTILGEYVNCDTKVSLLCPSGHEWKVKPSKFKEGVNCRKCMGKCPEEVKKIFLKSCQDRGYKILGKYVDSRTKVKLLCPSGHEWEVTPSEFKRGTNCKNCISKLTKKLRKEFFDLCNSRGYVVLDKYVNSNTKVSLLCPSGHEWEVKPTVFKRGTTCRKCIGRCPEETRKTFFSLCEKRGYKVLGKYVNGSTKVKLLCPSGHEWEVQPTVFKRGVACGKCAGRCPEETKKIFFSLCEKRGYKILGKYVDNDTKVKVLCPLGHEWKVTPNSFKTGTNCIKCAKRCSVEASKAFYELCIRRGYKVLGKYINNVTRIKLLCPVGHEWSVIPRNFKQGANCRKCDGQCPEEAKKKWESLMLHYKYIPLTEYIDSKTKVLIRCSWCDKEFWTIPAKRYDNQRGCPRCSNRDTDTTRELFYEKLLFNNITPIELYINCKKKILVKHNSCETEWHMYPGKFLYSNKNGCPTCTKKSNRRRKSDHVSFNSKNN
ncbi:hypothetical protein COK86_28900 [Bacillus cereus]|uniref:Zinc-ribbon domain-containing protein n=2 Tax=Bacillus cereus TaxID=1396 RepID=A0A2B3TQ68_BACCE|nr:hypothetical protein COK86_28900 [Bacillus cereus]